MNQSGNKCTQKVQFLQQNIDKNPNKMHTCLQIALELNIDFILFQELYINVNNMTTISHSAFYCIIFETERTRPRVMILAQKTSRLPFCQTSDICANTGT